jgi:N-formylglutamate amidohydrolase
MQETPPYAYDEAKAMQAQPILRALLTMMLAWGKSEAR